MKKSLSKSRKSIHAITLGLSRSELRRIKRGANVSLALAQPQYTPAWLESMNMTGQGSGFLVAYYVSLDEDDLGFRPELSPLTVLVVIAVIGAVAYVLYTSYKNETHQEQQELDQTLTPDGNETIKQDDKKTGGDGGHSSIIYPWTGKGNPGLAPGMLQQLLPGQDLDKLTPHQKETLVAEVTDKFRFVTNVSSIWSPDSVKSKITPLGAASQMLCVNTLDGHMASLGVVKTADNRFSLLGMYATPNRTFKATKLMPLLKADSYCFEIAIEPKTGQIKFWVNDSGYDMGVLDGFKGGAHAASQAAFASKAGDHLLPGTWSDFAVAEINKTSADSVAQGAKWSKGRTETSSELMFGTAPHHEVKLQTVGSVSYRDLRTTVV